MHIGSIADTQVIVRTGDAEGVLVRRFVDNEQAGATTVTMSVIDMPVGTVHRLHRHPNAEQIVYVQSGTVEHLTPEGRTPLTAGEFVFIKANEWHGVGNPADVPAMTVVVVGLMPGEVTIGYEAHPQQYELPE
jgi:quercetin dioxygenase-like cupin family protein